MSLCLHVVVCLFYGSVWVYNKGAPYYTCGFFTVHLFGAVGSVQLCHRVVAVAQKGEVQLVFFFELFVGGDGVRAYTQDPVAF